MTRTDRRRMLGGLACALALTGCTRADRFLSLDGRTEPEGGIGGTGIVGVITALGSIEIGGLTVATPDTARVFDAFGGRPLRSLEPGQSLTVEASGPPDALVARRIQISQPLVGRVETVSDDGRSLTVMGTRVDLDDGVNSLAQPGLRVAVSGLWDGRRVVASRIDVPLIRGPEVIAGVVEAGRTGPTMAGLRLLPTRGITVPPAGTYATLMGRSGDGVFIVDSLTEGRFTGAAGSLGALVVEGYLEPIDRAPSYAISGLGHSFAPDVAVAPLAGSRAVYAGPYDGQFGALTALPLPDRPAERRALFSVTGGVPGATGSVPLR